MGRLQNNQKFFKEICEEKLRSYLDQIKFDIKTNVYDRVIKQTLHHIYKHYDNLQKKSEQATYQSLQEQISKVREQSIALRAKFEQLEMSNNLDQQKLEMMINEPSTLKSHVDIVQTLSVEELQQKLFLLQKNNQNLRKENERIQQRQNQQIYNVKFQQEIKARKLMEVRAMEIAFENIEVQNEGQMQVA